METEAREIAYATVLAAANQMGITISELCKALEAIGFAHMVDRAGMRRKAAAEVVEPPVPGE